MISNLKKLPKYDVYNLGGPNRVNRIDMAQAVFEHFGYDKKYILPIEQKAETVPLDISMNNQKLQEFTGIVHEPATLKEMVELTFPKPIWNFEAFLETGNTIPSYKESEVNIKIFNNFSPFSTISYSFVVRDSL